jgi:hypothetical protein
MRATQRSSLAPRPSHLERHRLKPDQAAALRTDRLSRTGTGFVLARGSPPDRQQFINGRRGWTQFMTRARLFAQPAYALEFARPFDVTAQVYSVDIYRLGPPLRTDRGCVAETSRSALAPQHSTLNHAALP